MTSSRETGLSIWDSESLLSDKEDSSFLESCRRKEDQWVFFKSIFQSQSVRCVTGPFPGHSPINTVRETNSEHTKIDTHQLLENLRKPTQSPLSESGALRCCHEVYIQLSTTLSVKKIIFIFYSQILLFDEIIKWNIFLKMKKRKII